MKYLLMIFMKVSWHTASSLKSFHQYSLLFLSSITAKPQLIRLKPDGMSI